MSLMSILSLLIGTLAPILEEEAAKAAEAGSAMGPAIWIVLMVLAVVLTGAVWYATTRIQPPSAHEVGRRTTQADSH